MTIERRIIRLLLVISVLIVVLGAWFSGEEFLQVRTFHQWSMESGCIAGGFVNWCDPERRAEAGEFATLHRKAATEYAARDHHVRRGLVGDVLRPAVGSPRIPGVEETSPMIAAVYARRGREI